jgi:hypothetical protein
MSRNRTYDINDVVSEMSQEDIDRFWSKVDIKEKTECWNWLASDNGNGYGRFYIGGGKKNAKTDYAHRVSYILSVGNIPEKLEIDHLCKNRRCVNPNHLEVVTRKENNLRSDSLSAQRAKQTTCKRGHPLSGNNLYEAGGRRLCRTCREENRIQNKDRNNKKGRERYLRNNGGIRFNNKGERNGQAKLTTEDVKLILDYSKNGIEGKELSKIFNVSEATISRVISRKIWKDVTI